MNHKCGLCCLSVICLVLFQGCLSIVTDHESVHGSGKFSERIDTLTGIRGVQLTTSGKLEIRVGDEEKLHIEADDNLLQYIETARDGDILRIGTKRGYNLRPSRSVRYTLTTRELEFIGLSSSGDAHAPALEADRFEIRLSSSGDLSLDGLEADSLEVHLSSSGDLEIGGGRVDTQEIRISSSGDYTGASLLSRKARVRSSSSGDARVWAEESLEAELSSSGSVYYAGDPEIREDHSSSGRVRPMR